VPQPCPADLTWHLQHQVARLRRPAMEPAEGLEPTTC